MDGNDLNSGPDEGSNDVLYRLAGTNWRCPRVEGGRHLGDGAGPGRHVLCWDHDYRLGRVGEHRLGGASDGARASLGPSANDLEHNVMGEGLSVSVPGEASDQPGWEAAAGSLLPVGFALDAGAEDDHAGVKEVGQTGGRREHLAGDGAPVDNSSDRPHRALLSWRAKVWPALNQVDLTIGQAHRGRAVGVDGHAIVLARTITLAPR